MLANDGEASSPLIKILWQKVFNRYLSPAMIKKHFQEFTLHMPKIIAKSDYYDTVYMTDQNILALDQIDFNSISKIFGNSVKEIDLSNNKILGIVNIADLLEKYPNLTTLNLNNNLITEIIPPLMWPKKFKTLLLNDNCLESIRFFRDATNVTLYVKNNTSLRKKGKINIYEFRKPSVFPLIFPKKKKLKALIMFAPVLSTIAGIIAAELVDYNPNDIYLPLIISIHVMTSKNPTVQTAFMQTIEKLPLELQKEFYTSILVQPADVTDFKEVIPFCIGGVSFGTAVYLLGVACFGFFKYNKVFHTVIS